jgi:hypothetical protein
MKNLEYSEITFDIDNEIVINLLDERTPRDEKIFRLISGIGVDKQHSVSYVAREMNMKTSEVMNSYRRTVNYLRRNGVDINPNDFRLLDEK